jgi:hypothetical protein
MVKPPNRSGSNFPIARLALSPHSERMGKPQTKFDPVQMKAEPMWYVRITLPHGEQIHINEFTTEAEALTWIDGKSTAWLKKYRGGRYA